MTNEKLISEVFKYPYLYDKADAKHLNKDYLSKAWTEIALALNTEAEQTKKRWSNLRDYFSRQLREEKDKRSGDAASSKKKWVYFDMLSFLIPYIQHRELTGNLPGSSTESESVSFMSEESQDVPQTNNEDMASILTPVQPQAKKPAYGGGKKTAQASKRKAVNDVASEVLKAIQEPEPEADDDEQFFKSCLPMVRMLTKKQKLKFCINIQQQLLYYVQDQPRSLNSSTSYDDDSRYDWQQEQRQALYDQNNLPQYYTNKPISYNN